VSIPPFYLCGPTASGKTALALALAEAWGGEVVNGDAFQVYRGLEILSAAPSEEEKSRCPHHLFGVMDPTESMDAAKYATLARPVIEGIAARGKRAIVVGGSGLYLKFLTHGVAAAPPGDEEIRAELDQLAVDAKFAKSPTFVTSLGNLSHHGRKGFGIEEEFRRLLSGRKSRGHCAFMAPGAAGGENRDANTEDVGRGGS
jgi:DNA polymerase III delta prime subunit